MAEWEANCSDLIAQGYGSTPRHLIPADWRTRRGPDNIWGSTHRKPYPKRQTWRERRALYEAAKKAAETPAFCG